AVQRPMPRTWVSSAMTASSSMSGQRCTRIAPSRKCCARSAMYSTLRSDRPQARSSLLLLARTLCGVTAPAQRQTLSQTLCAALTEICWPTMARESVTKGSPRRARNTFGRERMMAAMTGSFRASARFALPVERRVGAVQNVELDRAERALRLDDQAPHAAEARSRGVPLDRLAIGEQQVAVAQGRLLLAKKQLGGAQLQRIVAAVEDV